MWRALFVWNSSDASVRVSAQLLIHLAACLWALLGHEELNAASVASADSPGCSWLGSNDSPVTEPRLRRDGCVTNWTIGLLLACQVFACESPGLASQYGHSFYFVLISIATVGYGDVKPFTPMVDRLMDTERQRQIHTCRKVLLLCRNRSLL